MIQTAILRIERRCSTIDTASDFLKDDEGIDRLDDISMMLIAIGGRVKTLDKITNGLLLNKYRDVDWKGIKGIRDILSHHYFDLDVEVVHGICKDRIQGLKVVVDLMLTELDEIDGGVRI